MKKSKKKPRLDLAGRVSVSVAEWCASTGTSKPSAYRLMSAGDLHFVQLSPRTRRIPTTEYERLGLVPA